MIQQMWVMNDISLYVCTSVFCKEYVHHLMFSQVIYLHWVSVNSLRKSVWTFWSSSGENLTYSLSVVGPHLFLWSQCKYPIQRQVFCEKLHIIMISITCIYLAPLRDLWTPCTHRDRNSRRTESSHGDDYRGHSINCDHRLWWPEMALHIPKGQQAGNGDDEHTLVWGPQILCEVQGRSSAATSH